MTRRKAILLYFFFLTSFLISIPVIRSFYRKKKYQNVSVNNFKELIDELCEVIIPRTSTPGAKDAGVSGYIINVINNCYSEKERRVFIRGISEVDEYCAINFKSSFESCSDEIKIKILEYFETKDSFDNPLINKIKKRLLGVSFFDHLKWLTITGYCNSRLGATQGLRYNDVPVQFVPCMEYEEGQLSWATK